MSVRICITFRCYVCTTLSYGKKREKTNSKSYKVTHGFPFLFFTSAPVLWLVFLCLWKTKDNAICNILSLPQNFFTLWRSTAYALSIRTDARVTQGSVLKLHGAWGFGREMWSGTQWRINFPDVGIPLDLKPSTNCISSYPVSIWLMDTTAQLSEVTCMRGRLITTYYCFLSALR